MKKMLRLVSIQLWGILGDMLSVGKNRKKRPKVIYVGVLLLVLFLSMVSFLYNMLLGSGLNMFGCINILPSMIMSVTCIITFMTTIFKVKGTIFGFRDYDMVMSLPVSTGTVVASRLFILYALNFLFILILMVPMMITYGILANPDIVFYVFGFITMFFIPLVPIVIASIFGTIIAYTASKFRHSNVLTIILSFGIIALIVVASFSMGDNGQQLADMSKTLTQQANRIYALAGMYDNAVVHYHIAPFLLFLGISIATFLVYVLVVKKVFKRMNTLIMTGSYHSNYKLGQLKTSSPIKALFIKEIKRYFSSTIYVFNTGFGIIMLTLGAIAAMFVDLEKIMGGAQATTVFVKGVPFYITFCIVMTCTTMASISLEGKNMWIIKSMPLTPRTVYLSKIAVNLVVLSPAIIDTIIIGIVLKLGLWQTIGIILVTIACSVFIAFYGLFMNLLLPNLNWTSEVIVVKQSAATLVTVFTTMGYVGIQALLTFLIPSATLSCLSFLIFTIVLDVVLYIAVTTYGNKRYYAL